MQWPSTKTVPLPAAYRMRNQESDGGWQGAHFMAADGSGSLAVSLALRSETASSKSVCTAQKHISAVVDGRDACANSEPF